jgi:hypothetical protein
LRLKAGRRPTEEISMGASTLPPMHTPEPPSGAAGPSGAIGVYSRAIRRHWQVVLAVTLAALVGGILWTTVRSPSYEATAQVYVTPLASDDPTYFGLPLLRDSGDDPTRVLKTASKIVRSPEAAQRAAQLMGPGWTGKRVLDHIDVSPEAQSSILNVKGSADEARESALLANNFSKASLEVRARKLQALIAAQLKTLRGRQATFRQQGGAAPADLSTDINRLEAISGNDDPTLSLSQSAGIPTSPAGVSTPIVIALALLAGLTLGIAAALGVGKIFESTDLLIRISGRDPITIVSIAGLLAIVALGACIWPARRATQLDPLVALRYE